MYEFKFIIISIIIMFASCSAKTKDNHVQEKTEQQANYIIDENLTSNNYSDFEGYFPKTGLVPTADIAFQIAETILKNIYGEETIEREKPFYINLKNDIWIIEGHLEEDFLGGVAYIEIRKSNGEILKVIHTK